MNKYKYHYQSDEESRKFIKEKVLINARDIFFPVSRFDPFDIYYLPKAKLDENGNDLNNKMRFVEIKTRNFNHDKYPTTIVEKDKFLKMSGATFCTDIPTELIVLFEDGFLYYSAEDVFKYFEKYSFKKCPDQYDAYGDKWKDVVKEVAEIKIIESKFHSYVQRNSMDNTKQDS